MKSLLGRFELSSARVKSRMRSSTIRSGTTGIDVILNDPFQKTARPYARSCPEEIEWLGASKTWIRAWLH